MKRRDLRSGRDGRSREIAGTFWLPQPLVPSAAWDLIAMLRACGPAYAPAWFRAGAMPGPRMLGRKSEPLAVAALASGEGIELLRRAGVEPRTILWCGATGSRPVVRLFGPPLYALDEALAFIHLIRDLCTVLRPIAGVVDEDAGPGSDHEATSAAVGVSAATSRGAGTGGEWDGFPAWVTVLGPDKVDRIGASRLLMAPVFLIDPLNDGGLLIAATPLPRDARAVAGCRSTARSPHLQGRNWWPGVPFISAEEPLTLT